MRPHVDRPRDRARRGALLLCCAGLVCLLGPGCGSDKPAVSDERPGVRAYRSQCASCHGDKGHGDGPQGVVLNPPPPDFVKGPWKHGRNEKDIRRVTVEGLPPTMPPTTRLSAEELDDLVKYVLELADAGKPPAPKK